VITNNLDDSRFRRAGHHIYLWGEIASGGPAAPSDVARRIGVLLF
jgi:hypothetical protein